jgi:acetate kinase
MKVLVLNSGSSSQKACLYEIGEALPDDPPACMWEGRLEFGRDIVALTVKNAQGVEQKEQLPPSSREQAVRHLLATLSGGKLRVLTSLAEIDVIGHRIVHGGPHFEEPVQITPEVRKAIAGVADLAPLHIPAAIEGMEIARNIFGGTPQMAVFDTGFHRQMPPESAIYPGPYEWADNGIRRYGFHGINHQYCGVRAADLLKKDPKSLRLVTCHLGNGCSVTAIQGGRSIDTTMGFTPIEGLMMGTRSGSVDPGILTYLMRQRNLDAQRIDEMLNHESGLLGISGVSGDMREVLAAVGRGNKRAQLAFNIFIHRLQAAIGGMAAVLGGIDALVFTAGIGENSPDVREAACSKLGFLGIEVDSQLNAGPKLDADISSPSSGVRVLVIRAQEDRAIAKECWKLMRARNVAMKAER